MKRFSIILLGALAMLMAGCSKDVHTASDDNKDHWLYNEDLPVPIQFGISSGVGTKAVGTAIETLQGLKDDIDAGKGTISVFAFDKSAAAWDPSDPSVAYLQNVSAKLGEIDESGSVPTAELTFNNGPYYYPLHSTANYTFYSYYARVSDGTVTYEGDQVFVKVSLGHTDLLYAKAEAELIDGYQGYNARYIRKVVSEDKAPLPTLDYKHATASVHFSVQKKSAYPDNPKTNQTITVNRVTVYDLLQTAKFCIADRNGVNDGVLYEDGSAVADTKLKNTGSLKIEAVLDKQTDLGTLFIFPQKVEADGSYQSKLSGEMYVTITNTTSNTTVNQTIPFSFDLGLLGAETAEGFQAGRRYNVLFTVYEAEDIRLNVTVSDYEEEFDYRYVIE